MKETESVTIRTSPGVLSQQAADLAARIHRIGQRFETIEETITGSQRYWSGEAAEVHRRVYRESVDGISEVLAGFRETADVLEAIAVEYRNTDQAQAAGETGLMTDVIQ